MIQFRSKYSNKVNEETVSNYEKKKKWIKKMVFLLANSVGSSSRSSVDWPYGECQILARNGMMKRKIR